MEVDNLEMKKSFYNSLNERQKRHFLGIEAKSLGHGGINLVSSIFQVNRDTVSRGLQELNLAEEFPCGRIRKEGGGRKKNS